MNDDGSRVRRALQEALLPPAPATLRARLELLAHEPVPARSARWRTWGPLAAAAILLIAVGAALSGFGTSPLVPATGLTHFDEGGLAFDYPTAWRAFHY